MCLIMRHGLGCSSCSCIRTTGDHYMEHWDTVGVWLWGDYVSSGWSCESSWAFISSLLQGCCSKDTYWTERIQRSEWEEEISEEPLMVWPMNSSDWLLKAACFEQGRTISQAGPRKLLFTYKMCQKGELYLSALKATNQRETNHQINRFLCQLL